MSEEKSQITASDFCNFWVSDSAEPCHVCDNNPPRRGLLVIKGQHYCLWCAMELARTLLGASDDGV